MTAPQLAVHPKIFISHSWADKELVRRLETELMAAGAEVWVDHAEVRAGDVLPKEISDALAWCDTVLLAWSRDAAQSHWVELEWTCAVALRKLIVPCRMDKTELPALLSNLLYLDFSSVSQGMAQLREAVLSAQKPVAQMPATPAEQLARFLRFQISGELPAVWNIPFHRNPNFTGRAELLAELRAALTKDKTAALTQAQAIHGLGGVGKTQLALEYAYRFAPEFQIVWWLRAEEPATLATDFSALATALELPEKEAQDQTAIIHAVRQWLDHHNGWLLIFDNAQQPQDLLPYLPQAVSGQVLITSRNPQWKGVAQALKVQVWPRAESLAFLLRRSGAQDEQAANAVANALGDLPLALEQASAYVEATGVSLADYLTLFQQYCAALLQEHQPLEYDATVATTWEISFQKLKTEDPVAVDLLNALSFLAPDNIPRSLLIDGRKHLPEQLSKALSKPLETNRAIASLARFSLVEASVKTLSLHRLVQAVTLDRLGEGEQKMWAEAVLKTVVHAWPDGTFDIRSWPECARLLPHSYAVAEHAEKSKIESTELALLLVRMGFYLEGRALYNAAEPLYRRALEIDEKAYGPEHPEVATDLNNLALLLKSQAQYAAAEPLYRRSLEIREKQLGPDHLSVATALNNLAELLRAQGQYAAAEPLNRRSLEILEKQLGPDHPHAAISLNNLAALLHAQGQYAAAEPLFRRSLEILEKQLGRDHPQVATGLNNLAGLLESQGQYAAAEALYYRSLRIREKQLGPDHPDVATSLNNLAELLGAQGQYAAAELLYRRSLDIAEKAYGPEHPDVATDLNNLAVLLKSQGQYAAAEPLYRRSLEIREKQLGPDHPNVAQSLNNLAGLLESQDQHAAAEPLYRRSLEIWEKQLGRDHPLVATGLNNLAGLLESQGQYAAAEPLYRRSLKIKEKQLGPDHPSVAIGLNNLALLLKSQSQYAAAEPLFRRSLEIREKQLGPDHPDVATSLNNLAGLLESQGQYAAAEPLYRRSLEIDEKAYGPEHPEVATDLNNLAELLKSQGQYAAAEPLFRRSLEILEKQLGPDHPDVAKSLNNLALLLKTQGQYAAAEPLYRRSLEIREQQLAPEHPDVAQSLNNLARLLESRGQYAAAEPLYRRSLEIFGKTLGPHHPNTRTVRENLALLQEKLQ